RPTTSRGPCSTSNCGARCRRRRLWKSSAGMLLWRTPGRPWRPWSGSWSVSVRSWRPTRRRPNDEGRMTTILVVDDNAVDLALAGDLLRHHPEWKVHEANGGREALEMIARQPPDLVLTDLVMPDLDGLAIVEEVRARHPLVPVILMTAYGSEEVAV